MERSVYPACKQTEVTELVRGNEQEFLARLTPQVHRQSIMLDLGSVQRIDAAGISALIALYARAYEAGHRFTVTNATPHVAEILALVGLERILVSHHANKNSYSSPCFERTAA
jgi:anti-anti-sigma factor